jgi:hypothetical protein
VIPKPERSGPRCRRRIARGKRPRPVRETLRAALIRDAHRLIRDIVFSHYGACQRCGKRADDPAHGVNRNRLSVAWDARNVFALCRACHNWFHDGRSKEWRAWRACAIGLGEVLAVEDLARTRVHLSTLEISEVVDRLEAGITQNEVAT